MEIVDISKEELYEIEDRLEEYDSEFTKVERNGRISIGIREKTNGKLIAGLGASMTAFNILYLSTLFVDKDYRRKGYGKALIQEMEKQAKELGANMIRLDTFSWQGKDFYLDLGYEIVGYYRNDIDDFEEYFFLKRI